MLAKSKHELVSLLLVALDLVAICTHMQHTRLGWLPNVMSS